MLGAQPAPLPTCSDSFVFTYKFYEMCIGSGDLPPSSATPIVALPWCMPTINGQ